MDNEGKKELSPYLKDSGKMTIAERLRASYSEEGFREVMIERASRDGLNWNEIAKESVGMYLSGKYTQKEIAEYFGVKESELRYRVDLKGIRMRAIGDAATNAYLAAAAGDKEMVKFVLERKGDWNSKNEVAHSGEIGLRPILNIGVKELTKTIEVIDDDNAEF